MTPKQRQPMRKAAGYVRVSTAGQADNGMSLSVQRDKIRTYAKLHDLRIVRMIEDRGESAKSLDRPGMGELLELVRAREVDVVIAAKLDRLTRSVRDLGDLIELLGKAGVELAAVADNVDTRTASGRLVVHVMASVSQWERETAAERTSEALQALKASGKRYGYQAPFGWSFTDSGRMVQNRREQAAIRMARELRAEGLSLADVSARLARRGYVGRKGQPLSRKVLAAILRREAAE